MKVLPYVILLIYVIVLMQPATAQCKNLDSLLYARQYPGLEVALASPAINKNDKMLYQAFLLNAYNRPKASENLLAKIFSKKIRSDDCIMQFNLHRIGYDNQVKLNNYGAAYAASEILLANFTAFFDSLELEQQKQESKIWKMLRGISAQKISAAKSTNIPITHDLAGLWNIPAGNGESSYQFIFDTGAGMSTITDTYAKKLKLDIIANSSVAIRGGINGISTNAKLAVARKLQIGNHVVQNAVFLVFPDSTLSFAGGAYRINGIIGLPIIKEFGEVIISSHLITIPLKKDNLLTTHNMILDLLCPVVYIDFKGELIPCTFDSGAQTSLFSDKFYSRFKSFLVLQGKHDSTQVGGAGGSRQLESLRIPQLNFAISNSAIQLLDATISLEPLPVTKKYYYGNIGQDVINQFKNITLNFLTSTISLAK